MVQPQTIVLSEVLKGQVLEVETEGGEVYRISPLIRPAEGVGAIQSDRFFPNGVRCSFLEFPKPGAEPRWGCIEPGRQLMINVWHGLRVQNHTSSLIVGFRIKDDPELANRLMAVPAAATAA
jgi:hypothetical protein